MPDNKLNDRLREWMTGEPKQYGNWPPPPFDTDPAMAIKLLEWLIEKGWRLSIRVGNSKSYISMSNKANNVLITINNGCFTKVLPEAIANVADEILKQEW